MGSGSGWIAVAMLNYAHGILESQVRMQVVSAGLDPAIGHPHGLARGKPGLALNESQGVGVCADEYLPACGFFNAT